MAGASSDGEPSTKLELNQTTIDKSIHAQDAGPAAHIENDLVLEEVLVLIDGISVRSCADLIFL